MASNRPVRCHQYPFHVNIFIDHMKFQCFYEWSFATVHVKCPVELIATYWVKLQSEIFNVRSHVSMQMILKNLYFKSVKRMALF